MQVPGARGWLGGHWHCGSSAWTFAVVLGVGARWLISFLGCDSGHGGMRNSPAPEDRTRKLYIWVNLMMCFVLFVYVMPRWERPTQLDRDDPFEMVLKTCHHLRAEGMS